MTERAHDKEMEALKAEIANLREELAGIADGMKKTAGVHAKQAQASHQKAPGPDGEGPGVWADLWHKLDSSKTQGEKVLRDLSAEVEHHPLVSVIAAFGLGYIIAKLWYRENKQ